MLKIGDFSKLSRISIRMLRHYGQIGLLTPKTIDDFTGYRYYSEEQLSVAGQIMELKDMGFCLSTIGEILKSYEDPHALAEYLSVKRIEIRAQSEELRHQLLLLDTAIERLRKDDTAMHYNVTIKTLSERYVASIRQVIPSYSQEGMLWDLMRRETREMHMQIATPSYVMAIFHDEGHKESDVDVEIQMSVKGNYENTEHVVFKTVPAVEFASTVIKGSYEQFRSAYTAVAQWIRDNGYEFNGMMFCTYHVSPHETQNPDEYITEVCYTVKQR